jgi:hypothetical protein
VEALLIYLLPEEQADTYRHKEIRSTDRLTYLVPFGWSCLAELYETYECTVRVYEPANSNRNAAYLQHGGAYMSIERPQSLFSDFIYPP